MRCHSGEADGERFCSRPRMSMRTRQKVMQPGFSGGLCRNKPPLFSARNAENGHEPDTVQRLSTILLTAYPDTMFDVLDCLKEADERRLRIPMRGGDPRRIH